MRPDQTKHILTFFTKPKHQTTPVSKPVTLSDIKITVFIRLLSLISNNRTYYWFSWTDYRDKSLWLGENSCCRNNGGIGRRSLFSWSKWRSLTFLYFLFYYLSMQCYNKPTLVALIWIIQKIELNANYDITWTFDFYLHILFQYFLFSCVRMFSLM